MFRVEDTPKVLLEDYDLVIIVATRERNESAVLSILEGMSGVDD